MPERTCRECGKVPAEGKIGRGGRCLECGEFRMVLGCQLNRVAARMSNRELKKLLVKLGVKHA